MHVGTWNVAGVAVDAFDVFLGQLSDNYVWDVLFLQEGFRRTEGIASEFGHLLFTPSTLYGNLRCPAVIVNERWKSAVDVAFVGSGDRWVAVSFANEFLFISLHLPHTGGHSVVDFAKPLGELRDFMSTRPERYCMVGMDANVEMGAFVDFHQVGSAVSGQQHTQLELRRATLLHSFLAESDLYLSNTFVGPDAGDINTRTNWSGAQSKQIDFLAIYGHVFICLLYDKTVSQFAPGSI